MISSAEEEIGVVIRIRDRRLLTNSEQGLRLGIRGSRIVGSPRDLTGDVPRPVLSPGVRVANVALLQRRQLLL